MAKEEAKLQRDVHRKKLQLLRLKKELAVSEALDRQVRVWETKPPALPNVQCTWGGGAQTSYLCSQDIIGVWGLSLQGILFPAIFASRNQALYIPKNAEAVQF